MQLFCCLILYNLSCETSFCYHLIAHEDITLHRRDAVTDGGQKFNLEDEGVAWYYLLAIFHAVNLEEIGGPLSRILKGVKNQQTAAMSLSSRDTSHRSP